MKKIKTSINNLFIIEKNEIYKDERGLFFESWNEIKFKKLKLKNYFKQDNISISKKNVLRGLHLQVNPKSQLKVVQVLKGKVLDVIVDLRKELIFQIFHQIYLIDNHQNFLLILVFLFYRYLQFLFFLKVEFFPYNFFFLFYLGIQFF